VKNHDGDDHYDDDGCRGRVVFFGNKIFTFHQTVCALLRILKKFDFFFYIFFHLIFIFEIHSTCNHTS